MIKIREAEGVKNSCRKKVSWFHIACPSRPSIKKKKRFRTKYPSTAQSEAWPLITDCIRVHSKEGNLTGAKKTGERDALGEASENLKVAAFLWLGIYLQHTGQTSVGGGRCLSAEGPWRKDLLPARSPQSSELLRVQPEPPRNIPQLCSF